MAETGAGQDGLGLDEVLAALRHDLLAAQRAGGGANAGLGVREVQIELAVEVSRTDRGGGEVGARWFVVSGSASGEVTRERTSTNRITLTLGPIGPDDDAASGRVTPEPVAGTDVSPGVIARAVAEPGSDG